jgi:SAM-dependent methyltransferase
MAKRPSLRGVYDPEVEKVQYDADYYKNHTKYYENGISNFIAFLKENFEFESIADVGCGTGAFVAPLQDEKIVYGYDFSVGSKEVSFLSRENYYDRDLAKPGATHDASGVNIVVSLETYEHIYPAFEMIYLENVFGLQADYVILSCAAPGQIGRRHVNCKSLDDVKKTVTDAWPTYIVDEDLTAKFKSVKKLATFYKANTIIFKRVDVIKKVESEVSLELGSPICEYERESQIITSEDVGKLEDILEL